MKSSFVQCLSVLALATVLLGSVFLITQCTDRNAERDATNMRACTAAGGTWIGGGDRGGEPSCIVARIKP